MIERIICTRFVDLIDTLWNVKRFLFWKGKRISNDLIDTLWNVKVSGELNEVVAELGFNRYIVECKALSAASAFACSPDLIDTLWNVKDARQQVPELLG